MAIMQPMYLPWKGIFDLAQNVDVFVFFDEAQFTSKSTKTRNYIKSPSGLLRLSVPTSVDSPRPRMVDVRIPTNVWQKKHARSIQINYGKLPGFELLSEFLQLGFGAQHWTSLVELNIWTTKFLASILGIRMPEWHRSTLVPRSSEERTARVVEIASAFGATELLNGPSARMHLDNGQIRESGITTSYMRYEYPPYDQAFPPFVHEVSVLDLIANHGSNAKFFLNGGLES